MKDMLKLIPRRTLTTLGLFALAVLAAHALVVTPRQKDARRLELQAASLSVQQTEQLQDTREITEWLRTSGKPRGVTTRAEQVSSASAVPSLLQQLSNVGSRHGIRVLSVRPDVPEAPVTVTPGDGTTRTYARIPIHLTARAEYRDLGGFLEELKLQGDLSVVRSVHLTVDVVHHAWNVELLIDAFGRIS